MAWPMLALLALAAARVTRLVIDDHIPLGWLRARLDTSRNRFLKELAFGLSCTMCGSVWAGAAAAGWAVWAEWAPADPFVFMTLWWAYAAAVILIEGTIEKLMGD